MDGRPARLVCIGGLAFADFTPAVRDTAGRRGRDTGSVSGAAYTSEL